MIIKSTGESTQSTKQTLKNRLLEIPDVKNVSYSSNGIGGAPAVSPSFEVNGVKKSINFITVDADFIDVSHHGFPLFKLAESVFKDGCC